MQNFEDYLCERNDTIDNAAYQLIGVLTAEDPGASLEDDPATPNWDMAIIGEVVDAGQGDHHRKGRLYLPSFLL